MQRESADSLRARRMRYLLLRVRTLFSELIRDIHREEVRVRILKLARNAGQGEWSQVNIPGRVIPSPALVPDVVVANVNRELAKMGAYPQAQDAPVT